ncbi:unnamed protein product [Larinioides sclopetarius]|uniref:Transporter n=1 Tax=Larinioides sclopetarius TaxID=280406 RepID=A0AAV2A0Z9_9ARAC
MCVPLDCNSTEPVIEATMQGLGSKHQPHFNPKITTLLPHSDHSKTRNEKLKKQRVTWSKQVEFVLSSVGYAVGLGNIWRFPYLCYKNGGGAFLVPYVFFLILCGLPMMFMETSLGQFGSLGSISIWKISPLFKGMGFGMAVLSLVVCIYYNVILAWSLYYIYHSYSVPWSTCGNSWNTLNCVSSNAFTQLTNISAGNLTGKITTGLNVLNSTFYILRQSSGIEDLGSLRWPLVLTLFLAWMIVFFCVSRGIKTSGKVVYVTATLPYLVLTCLLIRGLTLPGSWDGINFFVTPKWEKLLSFKVSKQFSYCIPFKCYIFYSYIIITISKLGHKKGVYFDSMVIACINYGTSLLAGFVVFSLLGFMACESGKAIEDVVSEGPGLAFVVYPEAISRLPVSSVWAFLFFFMLLSVGLDTVFGEIESTVSALVDEYPKLLRKRKTLFTAMVCGALFLLGLPCVTQGGIYVVQLMDWYCAVFALMLFSLCETIVVAWIYGADRFVLDICLMTKRMPSLWWKLCWSYVTPTIITVLFIFIFVNHTAITYNDYIYPKWSIVIGWILAMCSIAPIPVFAVWKLSREKGSLKQRLINSLRPTPDWGPALEEHKILYRKSLNIKRSRLEQKQQEEQPVSLNTFSESVDR